MKICMLAPEFIPVWGGVGTYIAELLRHLPKRYDLHVVAPARVGFGNDKCSNASINFSNFGCNVHIHFVSIASDTFFYNARFQYECFKQVPTILKEQKIDLIHSHTAHMPDLLLILRTINIPIITTVHSTIKYQRMGTKTSKRSFSDMETSEKATYIAYPLLRLSEEIYYRRQRSYITPSNWMKKWLEDSFHINQNISVIPNSIDISDYEKDSTHSDLIPEGIENKKIVLFVGRLLAMKGVEVLMQAIPKVLAKTRQDVLFVFVGPGDRTRYLKMAKALKIDSYCLFTGPLPRSDVFQLMRRSELLVSPSYIENAPYAILEAMACRLPVIGSNVGGVSEIIQNNYNGYLIEPSSFGEIQKYISNLLENDSLRDYMGQNAKQTVINKFSWSNNLKKYIEVYSSALSARD